MCTHLKISILGSVYGLYAGLKRNFLIPGQAQMFQKENMHSLHGNNIVPFAIAKLHLYISVNFCKFVDT
jgi:hypothetical protein